MAKSFPTVLAAMAVTILGTLPTAQAAGQVKVQWLAADQYSDAERSAIDRERVTQELGTFMRELGQRLPDGQTLSIEVTDLDLAGEVEPVGWRDFRVLRGGADWPRIELRFKLESDGRTLRQGQTRLSDMGYSFGIRPRHEPLGYEKRMIRQWFVAEFVAP